MVLQNDFVDFLQKQGEINFNSSWDTNMSTYKNN